ncbi:MAG: DUF4143 domain-containing protein [Chitinivibrionales bacterium]|nr:DUF4143 domain-containing protein [Chitinivibrionales bacterium]
MLTCQDARRGESLYYWHRESRSSNAEVDYAIQQGNTIIPVEVKSGTTRHLKSMYRFLEEHPDCTRALRFHGGNFHSNGPLESYPLYAVAGAVGIDRKAVEYLLNQE